MVGDGTWERRINARIEIIIVGRISILIDLCAHMQLGAIYKQSIEIKLFDFACFTSKPDLTLEKHELSH